MKDKNKDSEILKESSDLVKFKEKFKQRKRNYINFVGAYNSYINYTGCCFYKCSYGRRGTYK